MLLWIIDFMYDFITVGWIGPQNPRWLPKMLLPTFCRKRYAQKKYVNFYVLIVLISDLYSYKDNYHVTGKYSSPKLRYYRINSYNY